MINLDALQTSVTQAVETELKNQNVTYEEGTKILINMLCNIAFKEQMGYIQLSADQQIKTIPHNAIMQSVNKIIQTAVDKSSDKEIITNQNIRESLFENFCKIYPFCSNN
jgi:ATP-dependent Zn protease